MKIGVLKETQDDEYRVALLPQGVRLLTAKGAKVTVQAGAGVASGFDDDRYASAGAVIAPDAAAAAEGADLVVKILEPAGEEFALLRAGQALFAFLRCDSRPATARALLARRLTAVAMERVRLSGGLQPLLTPMRVIAGQQAVLQGANFLCNHRGGRGVSIVAYAGVEPAKIVVLGAGQSGVAAAGTAARLGANVFLFELDPARIRELSGTLPDNVTLLNISTNMVEGYLRQADMVIHTARAASRGGGHIIDRKFLANMKKGAVIVDVTATLNGGIESIDRYTTHSNPVWEVDGVIHYAVTNIEGTVARTASRALTVETMPYLVQMAEKGVLRALREDPALLAGLVAINGTLCCREAAEGLSMSWTSPAEALEAAWPKPV